MDATSLNIAGWMLLAVAGLLWWWRSSSGSRRGACGLVVAICAFGGVAGELLAGWRDGSIRHELLMRARHLAAGLDRSDLASHRNIAADVGQPWFVRTKTHLVEAKAGDDEVVYAYLLELHGSTLSFSNDDDPVDMDGYEPPGTTYDEAPAAMRTAVATGTSFALGPYSDRWGEFISVGTPIPLPEGRSMHLVLDLSATRWRQELWLWRAWPIALGLALGGLSLLFWSRNQALIAMRRSAVAAEEANRAKDGYLATVSHDLRNPLGGIIGMTGLLADTELNAEQREYVQLAHNSGQQLLSLVNELLDYARIEAGELDFDRIHCPVREVVEDAVALLAPLATAKGVELNAVVDHAVPDALLGDPDRIRQVLHNLISNAVKFTDDGEVVVSVTAIPDQATGRVRLTIAVRDTGIGIDGRTLERLFRPFAQGSEIGRRRGGTGLGLCIALRIAQGLGGAIAVDSVPGRGSTFTATMVLDRDPHPPERSAITPARRGARVVVAAMHPSLSASLCQLLRSVGLEPVPAASPEAIVHELATAPAAVLLDAAWSREAMVLSQSSGVPMALIAARNAGGTQMVATRRLPILLRPVRRDGLLRLMAGLWGGSGSTTRHLRQAEPAMEAQAPQLHTTPEVVPPAEADYDPSPDPHQRMPTPKPIPVAKQVTPASIPMLAGGLQGGLRSGIDAVREAARVGDLSSVRRAAQGLRSASEPLGLDELTKVCNELELAANNKDRGLVIRLAGSLEDIRRRAQQEISQMRRTLPADH